MEEHGNLKLESDNKYSGELVSRTWHVDEIRNESPLSEVTASKGEDQGGKRNAMEVAVAACAQFRRPARQVGQLIFNCHNYTQTPKEYCHSC